MEELDLRDLLSYFWNKFAYFLVIAALIVTIGCLYTVFLQKPIYTSTTSVILTGFSSEHASITQTDISINSNLVSTYQKIVKSRRVLNQVVENLYLDYEAKELAEMISVNVINDTEIIEISVKNEDAKEAYVIANEVADIFSKEAKELYNLSNVSILDYAEIASVPSNVNIPKQIILYAVIGFVFAFVVLFVVYYFDTTIKSVQDVERKFDLPILGSVPDYVKKKGSSKK